MNVVLRMLERRFIDMSSDCNDSDTRASGKSIIKLFDKSNSIKSGSPVKASGSIVII